MKGKVGIVFRREFSSTVKRPGWLISTFGMPVFVGLYGLLILFISQAATKFDKPTGKAGIVDHAGIVHFESGPTSITSEVPAELKDALDRAKKAAASSGDASSALASSLLAGTQFLPFADEPTALAALERKEIGAVYVVPADYIAKGKITAYDASDSIFSEEKIAQAPLRRLMLKSLTAERVTSEVSDRILSPVDVTTLTKQPDGTWAERGIAEIARRFGVPIGFTVLLLISLMVSAGSLIQGVSEEKESRVIEIILSSIDARSLLMGKLLGLGAAGLLQLAIWLSMAVVPLVLWLAGLFLSPLLVVLCLLYFVLGFLLYGTLITATGVLGTTAKDMQQYGMFWAIGAASPMWFMVVLLREPNGTASRILSFIPLTAPTTMMIRLGAGGVPAWEIVATLAMLTVSVVIVLRFAARIFRTGLLMYGKRPTLKEIVRWARQA